MINAMFAKPEPWTRHRACTADQLPLFFPEFGEQHLIREAKRICADCPVRTECLDFAYRMEEPFGVYGGMSANERRRTRLHPCKWCRRLYVKRAGVLFCSTPCQEAQTRLVKREYMARVRSESVSESRVV